MIALPRVLAETGATRRQLDFWVRCGYLRPDNVGAGTGTPRGWTLQEVAIARLMTQLVRAGFIAAAAAEHARDLHQLHPAGVRRLRISDAVTIELDPA